MREFVTAGKRAASSAFDDAEPITFKVDKDEFTAFPPTEGQLALMMATQSSRKDTAEHISGIVDFFNGLFEEKDQDIFFRRLMDRNDPFEFDMVQEIMESLIEEWAGRPTQPSRASTTSRRTTGRKSTAKPPPEG